MTLKLLILGPQRSGTSMLARCLHKSGIDMGEPFLGRNKFNVEGFFESYWFSIFLKLEIVCDENGNPRLADGVAYKATPEDIEKLTAFLETYDGQGYKHTYGLVLWDLFKRVIPKTTVIVLTRRKRREVVKSMAKVWPFRSRKSFEQVYDRLTELQNQVAREWPHIISVEFDELTTKQGQAKIQKRFHKYFPELRLDFSSITSKKKRGRAKRELAQKIIEAKGVEGEQDE